MPYSNNSLRNQSYSQPIDYGYTIQPFIKGNSQLGGFEDYSYPNYMNNTYSPYSPYSSNDSWKNSDPLPNPSFGMNPTNYPYPKSATMNIVNSDSSSILYGESAYRVNLKDTSYPVSYNSSIPSSFSQSQLLPTSPFSSLSSQPLYHLPQQGSILSESSLTVKKEDSVMTGKQTSSFHTVDDVKGFLRKSNSVTMIDPVKKEDMNGSGVSNMNSSGVSNMNSSGVSNTTGSNDSSGSTEVNRSNSSCHSIHHNSSSSKPSSSSSSTRKNRRKIGHVLSIYPV